MGRSFARSDASFPRSSVLLLHAALFLSLHASLQPVYLHDAIETLLYSSCDSYPSRVTLNMATNSNAVEVDSPQAPTTLAHPVPTDLPETEHIDLGVDGHQYRTRIFTLEDCEYFANMLSGRW